MGCGASTENSQNTQHPVQVLKKTAPTGKPYIDEPLKQGKAVLGYWNIRGVANPTRTLLSHLGIPFAEKRYEVKGQLPNLDLSDWFNDKFALGLHFPNLPYYIDSEIKLTESQAIISYICAKHKPEYLGRNHHEKAAVMVVASVLKDQKTSYNQCVYSSEFDQKRGPYMDQTERQYTQLAEFMGDKPYICSVAGPTWVDFIVLEELAILEKLDPQVWSRLQPKFANFQANMNRLNGVKPFLESCSNLPFNNVMAAFK